MVFSENDFTILYRYIGKLLTNVDIEKGKANDGKRHVNKNNNDCLIM